MFRKTLSTLRRIVTLSDVRDALGKSQVTKIITATLLSLIRPATKMIAAIAVGQLANKTSPTQENARILGVELSPSNLFYSSFALAGLSFLEYRLRKSLLVDVSDAFSNNLSEKLDDLQFKIKDTAIRNKLGTQEYLIRREVYKLPHEVINNFVSLTFDVTLGVWYAWVKFGTTTGEFFLAYAMFDVFYNEFILSIVDLNQKSHQLLKELNEQDEHKGDVLKNMFSVTTNGRQPYEKAEAKERQISIAKARKNLESAESMHDILTKLPLFISGLFLMLSTDRNAPDQIQKAAYFLLFGLSTNYLNASYKTIATILDTLDKHVLNVFDQAIWEDKSSPLPPVETKISATGPSIDFRNIVFQYKKGGENYALNGCTLEVKGGEIIALVGESGSGKTTLSQLLMWNKEPQAGYIKIGKNDLTELSRSNFQSHIACMPQSPDCFDKRTIEENVLYGIADASTLFSARQCRPKSSNTIKLKRSAATSYNTFELEIKVTSDKADQLSSELMSLAELKKKIPEKHHFPNALSEGEKQRISIARLFGKLKTDEKTKIIILDEPTSSIDITTAHTMMEKLLKEIRSKGATTIIITHELWVTELVDKIAVMKDGRIAEIGALDELRKKPGLFKKLWDSQQASNLSLTPSLSLTKH